MRESRNIHNDSMNMGYLLTDDKYNILYFNKYFKKIVNNNEDILKKKITVYFQDIKVDKKQELYPVKYIDNSVYYVMIEELKLYDHELYVFFFYDFSFDSELEKQILRLNRQQYLYNEMLNKLDDGIYVTDEEGVTQYVNDAFINLSGLNREQIIGKTVYDLINSDILPNSCCAKVIQTGGPVSTINNYYKGQRCLVSGSPIYDEEGKLSKTIAVIRDVSELDILMKNIAKEENLFIKSKKDYDIGTIESKKEPVINNENMKNIYNKALKIASVHSTVLILGETGVGKDFIASYIYNKCNWKDKGKFVKINCGAVPEHLLESEFFGYEEGAFTGAQKGGKKGLFEEANGGILYLDEIGDMPYTLQVKLLSSLNDRMFYRIGGIKPVEFNARIIAATNVDLKKLVDEKKFRADLYYRLNVVRFVIPPLRNRKEDIIHLSHQFLEYYNNKYGKNCYFSAGCLENFLNYDWPGNIREMKNIIERIILMSDDICIDTDLFRENLMNGDNDISVTDNDLLMLDNKSLKEKMEEYEKEIIQKTLLLSKNMKEASSILGIDISTLVRKKQKYNI
nr:sigma 54-interacting transcriptional regulator [Sedimentibacter sp.]